jgi:NtrC-family two-component system response regulator AlgB
MRNAVERAVILARSDRIASADLPAEMRLESTAAANPETAAGATLTLEKLEELHIRKVLERIPNLGEAAAILGIDQATLYRKRKKIGFE